MKILVTLTDDQLEQAATAGALRRVSAIVNRRTHYSIDPEKWSSHWESDIRAAIAEMGVCTAFGFDFTGYRQASRGDRALGRLADAGPFEVRTTMKPDGPLCASAKNVDHQIIIKTHVQDHQVVIDGWATAGEIRAWGYKRGAQYCLDEDELHSMSTFAWPVIASDRVVPVRPRTRDTTSD